MIKLIIIIIHDPSWARSIMTHEFLKSDWLSGIGLLSIWNWNIWLRPLRYEFSNTTAIWLSVSDDMHYSLLTAHASANAKCAWLYLNFGCLIQKRSGIRIRIYADIRLSAGSLPNVGLVIHSFVGVSHFAEFRDKRPVTVREMLINLTCLGYFYNAAGSRKWSGIRIRDHITTKS